MSNQKDFSLFHDLRNLRFIRRCNTYPTIHDEDVAQHSFYTAMLVEILGQDYNHMVAAHNAEVHPYDFDNQKSVMNLDKAFRSAFYHDIEEAYVSDIPYTVKHHDVNVHMYISRVRDDMMEENFKECGDALSDMCTYCLKAKKSKEGYLVNIADMLELAIYCAEEVSNGNTSILPILENALKILKTMPLYKDLFGCSSFFKDTVEWCEQM